MGILQIIPAVDVLDGAVVRLFKGDYNEVTAYGSDPVATAQSWQESGAGIVHVVDLAGARTGQPDLGLWTALGEAGVSFQAGGGIRTRESAEQVLAAGATRVVMGTSAVWAPEKLAGLGQQVVAAVDVRDGLATGSGWTDDGRELSVVLDDLSAVGVTRLLVTGIGRDGTLEGPDMALTRTVVEDSRFATIASGGVGQLADLDRLVALGCEAVIVGKALYEKRFTLEQALARVAG